MAHPTIKHKEETRPGKVLHIEDIWANLGKLTPD